MGKILKNSDSKRIRGELIKITKSMKNQKFKKYGPVPTEAACQRDQAWRKMIEFCNI